MFAELISQQSSAITSETPENEIVGVNKHYHLRAILMGVVRQEVKRSAGRSGFMGSSSLASQAASWMQFFMEGGRGIWASGWLGLMAAT